MGGNGIGFSANFDSRFTKTEKGLGFRIGIGILPSLDFGFAATSSIVTVPVGINYLIGNAPHYFEAGAGATYVSGNVSVLGSESEHGSGVGFIPSAGYRYAPSGKAFQGRLFISPVIGSGGSAVWIGVSFGIKF